MKLFIWAKPYHISYGDSMVIAVAENLEEAKTQALTAMSYSFGQYEQEGNPSGVVELSEPTRVLDVPCAEWHRWEE